MFLLEYLRDVRICHIFFSESRLKPHHLWGMGGDLEANPSPPKPLFVNLDLDKK